MPPFLQKEIIMQSFMYAWPFMTAFWAFFAAILMREVPAACGFAAISGIGAIIAGIQEMKARKK